MLTLPVWHFVFSVLGIDILLGKVLPKKHPAKSVTHNEFVAQFAENDCLTCSDECGALWHDITRAPVHGVKLAVALFDHC